MLSETRQPEPRMTSVYDVVDEVLDRSRRYFLDEADCPHLDLSNNCDRRSSVLVDRDMLLIALMKFA